MYRSSTLVFPNSVNLLSFIWALAVHILYLCAGCALKGSVEKVDWTSVKNVLKLKFSKLESSVNARLLSDVD